MVHCNQDFMTLILLGMLGGNYEESNFNLNSDVLHVCANECTSTNRAASRS